MFEVLYSKSKLGQSLTWQIEVLDDSYRTVEGMEGGKQTVSEWTKCFITNEGKANQRTPEQQAQFEAQAKFDKKLKTGYSLDKESAGDKSYVQCLLAEKYNEFKETITFPCEIQCKLNGVRCLITRDSAKSRKGEAWNTVPHVLEELKPLFDKYPEAVLDGELFNEELREQLNELTKVVKKKNITPEILKESRKIVMFYIYDGYGVNSSESDNYSVRITNIHNEIKAMNLSYIKLVESNICNNHEDITKYYNEFVDNKHEGAIIRWGNKEYIHSRSKYLLKMKPEDESEFELINVEQGSGNWSGMAKIVTFRDSNGKEFSGSFKGTQVQARQFLNEWVKLKGKQVSVKYNGLTGLGTPQYAQLVANNFIKGDR